MTVQSHPISSAIALYRGLPLLRCMRIRWCHFSLRHRGSQVTPLSVTNTQSSTWMCTPTRTLIRTSTATGSKLSKPEHVHRLSEGNRAVDVDSTHIHTEHKKISVWGHTCTHTYTHSQTPHDPNSDFKQSSTLIKPQLKVWSFSPFKHFSCSTHSDIKCLWVWSWRSAAVMSYALTCPRCHGWTWLWLPAVLVLHSPPLRQPRCLPPWYWLTAMSSLPEKQSERVGVCRGR